MILSCPQCGAAVEFRYDDSLVRVCDSCRSAITRTDRGAETLGKIADLAPLASPLALWAEGSYGDQSFLLIGKAQVRHSAGGLWQEWYAKFSGGAWGWLAEAQGRFTMTFEVPHASLPSAEQLALGQPVTLPTAHGARPFTVAELGVARYSAADGELPYRLTPDSEFRYADLSDGQGGFATIDYGAPHGREPATLYVGRQLGLADLRLVGGMAPPPPVATGVARRLACPNCNGSIELRSPDEARRYACVYCGGLLDVHDSAALHVLGKQNRKLIEPLIKLGTTATFAEGELTVIGYLRRAALVDGSWYPFDEYLLHAPRLGFRWLVCSDGHWSYVQPVSPGACAKSEGAVRYRDTSFRAFQGAKLRVDQVLGEFYWDLDLAEVTFGEDYVAPPAMLSLERSIGELNWSLATYLSHREVRAAVGDVRLPPSEGVAPNQPWPHAGVERYYALAVAAFLGASIILGMSRDEKLRANLTVPVPSGPAVAPTEPGATVAPDAGHVTFSEPFQLDGENNVEVQLSASLSNSWMYVVADLVNESTGTFVTFDATLEKYYGNDGGEAWQEGDNERATIVSTLPKGSYVLRIEAQHGVAAYPARLQVTVWQDVSQPWLWGIALIGVLLPGAFFYISARAFEKRRMANSTIVDRDTGKGDD